MIALCWLLVILFSLQLIRKPVSLEQKRAIERDDDEEDDISELLRRVNAAKLPSPARKAAMKEIKVSHNGWNTLL